MVKGSSAHREGRERNSRQTSHHIYFYTLFPTSSFHYYLLIPCPYQQIQPVVTLEAEATPAELLTTWLLDRLSLPVFFLHPSSIPLLHQIFSPALCLSTITPIASLIPAVCPSLIRFSKYVLVPKPNTVRPDLQIQF